MAALTQIRHGLFGRRYGSFAGKSSTTWTTQGVIMLAGATTSAFAFEATILAAVGTVKARLYNQTDGAAVALSEVSTAAATRTRVRSSAITIIAAKEYVAQFGKTGGDSGTGYGAVLAWV